MSKPAKKKPAPKRPPDDEQPKGVLKDFPIDMLKFEPALQARVGDASTPIGGLYSYHVEDLRGAVRRKESLPPVQVWIVPGRGNLVTDGHHTTEAYRLEGRKTVPAETHEGTWLDAVKAASAANAQHKALKRTNEDKRRAVLNLLTALKEAKETWSNGRVAKWCQVGDDLVAALVLRTQAVAPDSAAPKKGSDGREYKASVGKGKKEKKGKPSAIVAPPVATDPEPVAPKAEPTTAPAEVPSARVFDFPAFEGRVGAVYRDIDAVGLMFGLNHAPRTEGIRRLLREFKAEFQEWYNELSNKAKEKT